MSSWVLVMVEALLHQSVRDAQALYRAGNATRRL